MLSHTSPTHKLLSQDLSQQLGKSQVIAELCPNPVPRDILLVPTCGQTVTLLGYQCSPMVLSGR